MSDKKVTLEEARERYMVVRVHAPTLDDKMRPDFRLINMKCP